MTRICRQDVLRYLKIAPSQLRAWEQKGLISWSDTYSLEECGRLRTLRDLAARFSPSRINASLLAMKTLAGMENPLLEARAVAAGSRVHFHYRGSVTEPIGRQFVFDFEPAGASATSQEASRAPIPMVVQQGREISVAEMFLDAVRHEDASESAQASEIYERILQRDPNHAPTCINLGTLCYSRREFSRAEELYRHATIADPGYALAFFDLGNALDELKRLPAAITAYHSAIRLTPTYADAHYNLALAYERTGERRQALRHWTAYLKLDSSSRWAAHARKQVKMILGREGLMIVHRSAQGVRPRIGRGNVSLGTEVLTAG